MQNFRNFCFLVSTLWGGLTFLRTGWLDQSSCKENQDYDTAWLVYSLIVSTALMSFSKIFEQRLIFHFRNDWSSPPVLSFRKGPNGKAVVLNTTQIINSVYSVSLNCQPSSCPKAQVVDRCQPPTHCPAASWGQP